MGLELFAESLWRRFLSPFLFFASQLSRYRRSRVFISFSWLSYDLFMSESSPAYGGGK